ncbi:MAG: phytoene/squalene synthase family protein [Silicimonas sp.]|jgi:phytoene synthase|nr:phytoene/squalene synthase family protein [Silicimonas sp.]
MIDPNDMEHCREAIRHGSLSFHAASKLLPARVRDPALALYAFCRLADDEVDLSSRKAAAVEALRERLDLAYAGRPRNAAPDRAFTSVIETFEMPRALPEALLEGLAWDADMRRYRTLSELTDYSARVASAVGVMMCVLMRVRDRHALARAADLGAAMQLTNIARDVGEDALEGRLYLPLEWLEHAGIEPEAFMADPQGTKAVRAMVKRLLIEAEHLYVRSEAGIGALPLSVRPGIFAARFIYAAIGTRLRAMGHNSIAARAVTTRQHKAALAGWSLVRTGMTVVMPRSPMIHARPLAETAFLVEAAGDADARQWSDTLTGALASLKQRDLARAGEMQEKGLLS